MPAPNITPLPPAPIRSKYSDEFAQTAEDFVSALPQFSQEMNDSAVFVQDRAFEVDTAQQAIAASETAAMNYRDEAEAHKDAAAALVNFAGEWSSLTGSLSAPATVYHKGVYWSLLTDLANVTTSEPSTINDDWLKVVDKRAELREALFKEATFNADFANNFYELYEGPVDGLTARPFKDVFTFTRPSAATVRNALRGVVEVGVDDQRLAGNREGLLIEEARTNLLLWSDDFNNAVWIKDDVTVSDAVGASPIPNVSADEIIESATEAAHRIKQTNISVTAGTKYTQTIFVRQGPGEDRQFSITFFDGAGAWSANVRLNLATGQVDSATGATYVSHKVVPLKDGWYALSATVEATANSTTGQVLFVMVKSGNSVYTGDGATGIRIIRAQLEEGACQTSTIKTEVSQVPRSADNCSRTLGGEFNADEGTVFIDATQIPRSGAIPFFEYADASEPPLNLFRVAIGGDNNLRFQSDFGGVLSNEVIGVVPTLTEGQPFSAKIALTYDSFGSVTISVGDFGVWNSVTGLTADAPTIDTLRIASSRVTSVYTAKSKIRDFKFIPRALSDVELQALTS